MTELYLRNSRLVVEGGAKPGGVLIREGRIVTVFVEEQAPAGLSRSRTIDLEGAYLAPGMIDLHIHGSDGVDVLETDAEGLARLSRFLLGEGVTGYFPTLVPVDSQAYAGALGEIGSYRHNQGHTRTGGNRGARILGVHFEGPFVSKERCGALHAAYFRTYDGRPASLHTFTGQDGSAANSSAAGALADSGRRLMTLAPEIEGGIELIKDLSSSGARVFIGHTVAGPATLDLALGAGARHITHFPNALEPLHHRKPGAVAWGLVRPGVTIDCIADFHHVDPLMLQLMFLTKGTSHTGLISDAIPPAGLGDGAYEVWGDRIEVRGGKTSLAKPGPAAQSRPGGTIAGSVITMRQAVKNVVGLGVSAVEAILMASLVPARAAAIDREYGSIAEGKRADLIVVDDEMNVRLAIVSGEVALDRR